MRQPYSTGKAGRNGVFQRLFLAGISAAVYLASCMDVFDMLIGGHMKPEIGQTYYLKDVARAHADLEARRTKGSTVLVVSEEVLRG